METISVIIPMYNAEAYIKETLESVLHQTYRALEIIVVDDGSIDRSVGIVKEMSLVHPSVRLVKSNHKGVGAARNIGIRQSTGTYVAFIDSDDLWLPEKLERQVSRMQEGGFSSCYCGCLKLYCDRIIGQYPSRFPEGKITTDVLYQKTKISIIGLITERKKIMDLGIEFEEQTNYAEDTAFTLRVLATTNTGSVSDYLCKQRIRKNSLSAHLEHFSPEKMIHCSILNRFLEWSGNNRKMLYESYTGIERAILTYAVPMILILYKFKARCIGEDIRPYLQRYHLSKEEKDYVPRITFKGIEMYIKRIFLSSNILMGLCANVYRFYYRYRR